MLALRAHLVVEPLCPFQAEDDGEGPVGDLLAPRALLDRLPAPPGVLVLGRLALGEGERDRPGRGVEARHGGLVGVPTLEIAGDVDRVAGRRVGRERDGEGDPDLAVLGGRRHLRGVAGPVESRVLGRHGVDVAGARSDRVVGEGRLGGGPDPIVRPAGRLRAPDLVAVEIGARDRIPDERHRGGGDDREDRVARCRRRLAVGSRDGGQPHRLRRPVAVGRPVEIGVGPPGATARRDAHGDVEGPELLGPQAPGHPIGAADIRIETHLAPRPAGVLGRVAARRPEPHLGSEADGGAGRGRVALDRDQAGDGGSRPGGRERVLDRRRSVEPRVGDGKGRQGAYLVRAGAPVAGRVEGRDRVEIAHPVARARVGEPGATRLADRRVPTSADEGAPDPVGRRPVGRLPGEPDAPGSGVGGEPGRGRRRGEIGSRRGDQDGRPVRRQGEADPPVAHRRRRATEAVRQGGAVGQVAADVDRHGPLLGREVEDGDGRLGLGAAAEGERAGRIVGEEEAEVALAQRLVVGAQVGERPVVLAEPDLVAVVDRGDPRPGELEGGQQPQLRLALGERGGLLLDGRVVAAGRQRPEDPARVVRVDEVEENGEGGRRVVLAHAFHRRGEAARPEAGDGAVGVGGVAVDQPDDRPPEAVVHRRVRLGAEEPGGGVAPLLPDDEGVRVRLLDGGSQPPQ